MNFGNFFDLRFVDLVHTIFEFFFVVKVFQKVGVTDLFLVSLLRAKNNTVNPPGCLIHEMSAPVNWLSERVTIIDMHLVFVNGCKPRLRNSSHAGELIEGEILRRQLTLHQNCDIAALLHIVGLPSKQEHVSIVARDDLFRTETEVKRHDILNKHRHCLLLLIHFFCLC